MIPTLISIPYSPWSRRAAVALDRMGVAYQKQLYTPVLSEPGLRLRLRRLRGRITVPVLLWDGPPLTDSWDIVVWGSDRSDQPLAPPHHRDAVRAWHDRAERALCAGRLRTTTEVLASPGALAASLPPPMDRAGPVGRWIGRDAARRLLRKYGDGGTPTSWHDALARYCDELAEALSGGDHLLGEPSYADIAAAVGLSFIAPGPRSRVAEAARSCWTVPELAGAHPELLAWRDRILAPAGTA